MLDAEMNKLHTLLSVLALAIMLSGCSRQITMKDVAIYENETEDKGKIQWIYRETDGDFHYFIRFYTGPLGSKSYECVKIPTSELGIKIVPYAPNKIDDPENGNAVRTILPK
jgi:hypothetical protein